MADTCRMLMAWKQFLYIAKQRLFISRFSLDISTRMLIGAPPMNSTTCYILQSIVFRANAWHFHRFSLDWQLSFVVGLQIEGVFRVCGSVKDINNMKQDFFRGKYCQLSFWEYMSFFLPFVFIFAFRSILWEKRWSLLTFQSRTLST